MESGGLEQLIGQRAAPNGQTCRRARETLAAMGEPAVPSLVALLGTPDTRLRWEAAKALTQIPHPAAIPDLRRSMTAEMELSRVRTPPRLPWRVA